MELTRITRSTAEELFTFRKRITLEDWPDLVASTSDWFLAKDGEQLVALAGLILPSLTDYRGYLWMVKTEQELRPSQVLGGIRLAKKLLASMPWEMLAECAELGSQNEKFLFSCGFYHLTDLHDRQLYKWSA